MNKHLGSKVFCDKHDEIACEICDLQKENEELRELLRDAVKELREAKKYHNSAMSGIIADEIEAFCSGL